MYSLCVLALLGMASAATVSDKDLYASCVMQYPNEAVPNVKGTVDFRQMAGSDVVHLKVNVTGLNALDDIYLHGLHVHEFGTTFGGCDSMGGHWNPKGVNHGSPYDSFDMRHPGDFGNFPEDGNGNILMGAVDMMASLVGQYNINGHGLVLHEHYDDLGLGDSEDSLVNGNAGGRYACCVIAVADGAAWP